MAPLPSELVVACAVADGLNSLAAIAAEEPHDLDRGTGHAGHVRDAEDYGKQ